MGMFENGKAALPQGVHGGEAQDHAMLSRLSTPELMPAASTDAEGVEHD